MVSLERFIRFFFYVALCCALLDVTILLCLAVWPKCLGAIGNLAFEHAQFHIFETACISLFFVFFFAVARKKSSLEKFQILADPGTDVPIIPWPQNFTLLHGIYYGPLFGFCILTVLMPLVSLLIIRNAFWECT